MMRERAKTVRNREEEHGGLLSGGPPNEVDRRSVVEKNSLGGKK